MSEQGVGYESYIRSPERLRDTVEQLNEKKVQLKTVISVVFGEKDV